MIDDDNKRSIDAYAKAHIKYGNIATIITGSQDEYVKALHYTTNKYPNIPWRIKLCDGVKMVTKSELNTWFPESVNKDVNHINMAARKLCEEIIKRSKADYDQLRAVQHVRDAAMIANACVVLGVDR